MSAARYDALVALAQLVPGPASSQVGFALGLQWAGWRGAMWAVLLCVGYALLDVALLGDASSVVDTARRA